MKNWHVIYSSEHDKFRFVFGRKSELKNGAVGDGGIYYTYIGVL